LYNPLSPAYIDITTLVAINQQGFSSHHLLPGGGVATSLYHEEIQGRAAAVQHPQQGRRGDGAPGDSCRGEPRLVEVQEMVLYS